MTKQLEIFILAGRKFEANEFARNVGLTKDKFTYVFDEISLQGRERGQALLLVGNYFERKDSKIIIDLALARDFAVIRCND